MNQTIKEARVKRYHYDDHHQLRTHLDDFISAYKLARRLKALKGLSPLRIHLQNMDFRARAIQTQSDPSNSQDQILAPMEKAASGCNRVAILLALQSEVGELSFAIMHTDSGYCKATALN